MKNRSIIQDGYFSCNIIANGSTQHILRTANIQHDVSGRLPNNIRAIRETWESSHPHKGQDDSGKLDRNIGSPDDVVDQCTLCTASLDFSSFQLLEFSSGDVLEFASTVMTNQENVSCDDLCHPQDEGQSALWSSMKWAFLVLLAFDCRWHTSSSQ